MNRASAFLEIKAFREDPDFYFLDGIATTPTPDKIGDVVEPRGAQFKLPMPLLWQHDHDLPVGEVFETAVTGDGIAFKARIPKVKESGRLRDRLEEAVQSVKYKLVKGTSIGFKPVQGKVKQLKDGALHFIEWMWHELSLVTIPMNAEATIHTIKSAYGAASGRAVVRLNSPLPGASGTSSEAKGKAMATITEKITSWEAKRQAHQAARTAIMKAAEDDGDRTLNDAETTEYDRLADELKQVDSHLTRLREQEQEVKATAKPLDPEAGVTADKAKDARNGVQPTYRKDQLEPGIEFARYVKCHMLSNGNPQLALALCKSMYPDTPRIHNVMQTEASHGIMVSKANVSAATTTDATWAGALVQYQDFAGAFLEWLRPQTIVGKFGTDGVPALQRVPFNARVRAQTSGGTGYWVGEGKPKPLTKFDFANITMATTKVAAIAVITEETLRLSSPSADVLTRNALRGALIERLDRDFIDPDFAGSAGVSPASITYGQPTAAASGTINSAVNADVRAAMATFLAYNMSPANAVWIMSASTALALMLAENPLGQRAFPNLSMTGGTFVGLPVIVSEYAAYGGGLSPGTGNLLVLVNASEIFLADDGGVDIDASREASLQMLDNPTNDSVTPTATTMVSMYQTDSVAIRAHRFINWKVARTGAVAVITGAAYTGLAA